MDSMQQAAEILHRVGTSLQHAMPFQHTHSVQQTIAEAGANATRHTWFGFWVISRCAGLGDGSNLDACQSRQLTHVQPARSRQILLKASRGGFTAAGCRHA